MHSLSKTIISDPVNKWVFSNAAKELFLVGGYIRDLLLGHISKDKDYVIKDNVEEFALKTAKRFKGTFIILKKNYTYRVALKDRHFIDFTHLEDSINEDLKQRDFTINAIAWSPETGIIDPFGGINDLKNKAIKTVAPENLKEDPLRILRAYRHAAQLDFTIEKNARKYLRRYADKLVKIAPERITGEIFKILNNRSAAYYLEMSYKDGVLDQIFDIEYSRLKKNLKLLARFDEYISKWNKTMGGPYKKYSLNEEISQGLNRAGLIRLALLLLTGTHIIIENRPLRLSRTIRKSIGDIHNAHARVKGKITERKLYEVFRAAGSYVYEIALVLLIIRKKERKRFLSRADDFIKVKKKRLLTGNEIQKLLKIRPGAIIGTIQAALQEKQFYGIIKTKADAKAWVLSNFT